MINKIIASISICCGLLVYPQDNCSVYFVVNCIQERDLTIKNIEFGFSYSNYDSSTYLKPYSDNLDQYKIKIYHNDGSFIEKNFYFYGKNITTPEGVVYDSYPADASVWNIYRDKIKKIVIFDNKNLQIFEKQFNNNTNSFNVSLGDKKELITTIPRSICDSYKIYYSINNGKRWFTANWSNQDRYSVINGEKYSIIPVDAIISGEILIHIGILVDGVIIERRLIYKQGDGIKDVSSEKIWKYPMPSVSGPGNYDSAVPMLKKIENNKL